MFTFKTEQPTGKWKSFQNPQHYIKLKKVEVGRIDAEYPFQISFMVIKNDINEDKNPNCIWRWAYLKSRFNSLSEAKEFLNSRFDEIITKFNLITTDSI